MLNKLFLIIFSKSARFSESIVANCVAYVIVFPVEKLVIKCLQLQWVDNPISFIHRPVYGAAWRRSVCVRRFIMFNWDISVISDIICAAVLICTNSMINNWVFTLNSRVCWYISCLVGILYVKQADRPFFSVEGKSHGCLLICPTSSTYTHE